MPFQNRCFFACIGCLSLLEVVDSSKKLDDLMAKAIMKASHLAPYSNFGWWNLFVQGILYSQSK